MATENALNYFTTFLKLIVNCLISIYFYYQWYRRVIAHTYVYIVHIHLPFNLSQAIITYILSFHIDYLLLYLIMNLTTKYKQTKSLLKNTANVKKNNSCIYKEMCTLKNVYLLRKLQGENQKTHSLNLVLRLYYSKGISITYFLPGLLNFTIIFILCYILKFLCMLPYTSASNFCVIQLNQLH